ncbi:hypothetical protein CFK41_01275 [Brachybacterium ginsengisoli]|uniref:Glycoside hydrolase family 65 n=1 Tax=Brachybacterium ginsengisoli TaxID=1331682 RepID=A0A291GTQ2_9MICO|nr:hypothetical protein [Brachybacterium ginsengisoli]ATG53560.1 hypothetical protein CFK41_01275 [Brachybacterium ginsengisoli]
MSGASARPAPGGGRIDRRAVVSRHDPRVNGTSDGVLSVGNGSFAAGVDRTGTQTLCGPGSAEARLNTMAEWGWHTMPQPPPAPWESLLRPYSSPRGQAAYMDLPGGTEDPGPAEAWFRENPHKVSLLRFALVDAGTGRSPAAADLAGASQHLELWSGTIRSRFRYRGRECTVVTAADPEQAALALRIDAPGLALALSFPYGSAAWDLAADWDRPGAHSTRPEGGVIRRRLDDLAYDVHVHGAGLRAVGAHEVHLVPGGAAADGPLDVALELVPREVPALSLPPEARPTGSAALDGPRAPALVRERSARFWSEHWEGTGVLDLGAADDPRAAELERRAVLSRYVQRVHAAGVLPPAETGLLANSWRGKFHLEMHWWHAAHFAVWGDAASLRRSLDFYGRALPVARATAARQHCRGARWPKQIGPDLHESPSDIGPFLLWQQPHPIHLAELLRRADPESAADPMLQEVVEQTALCLVDLLREDADGLGVGPPLIGAQERHVGDRAALRDASFELAYAAWALRVADRWRHLRSDRGAGELTEIARRIHAPLTDRGELTTFRSGPAMERSDHPSHLLAHGMVPPTGTVPQEAAQRALEDVLAQWDWESTWGWDYPALAMTATRLRRPEQAVDALLLPTPKNRCDAAGHFPQRPGLPAYLPANGGTLLALALMAAGWDEGPDAPGLPPQWGARHEGIRPLPGEER